MLGEEDSAWLKMGMSLLHARDSVNNTWAWVGTSGVAGHEIEVGVGKSGLIGWQFVKDEGSGSYRWLLNFDPRWQEKWKFRREVGFGEKMGFWFLSCRIWTNELRIVGDVGLEVAWEVKIIGRELNVRDLDGD